MNFEGVLGRQIVLQNDYIEINVTGIVEKALGIPSVKINYENISSIELKNGDIFKKGFIHFILSGSGFERGSERGFKPNENPYLIYIPFTKFKEAESLVNEINNKIKYSKNKTSQPQNTTNNKSDIYEQLSKLSSLKDNGILTEEEFNKKKAELLSRM